MCEPTRGRIAPPTTLPQRGGGEEAAAGATHHTHHRHHSKEGEEERDSLLIECSEATERGEMKGTQQVILPTLPIHAPQRFPPTIFSSTHPPTHTTTDHWGIESGLGSSLSSSSGSGTRRASLSYAHQSNPMSVTNKQVLLGFVVLGLIFSLPSLSTYGHSKAGHAATGALSSTWDPTRTQWDFKIIADLDQQSKDSSSKKPLFNSHLINGTSSLPAPHSNRLLLTHQPIDSNTSF